MSLQKPAVIKKPAVERLSEYHGPNDTWCPYPRQAQAEPILAHTDCVVNGIFDLMLIGWDVCDYFFGDGKPEVFDIERANAFHQKLQIWAENLPACISLGCTSPAPAILDMQFVSPLYWQFLNNLKVY